MVMRKILIFCLLHVLWTTLAQYVKTDKNTSKYFEDIFNSEENETDYIENEKTEIIAKNSSIEKPKEENINDNETIPVAIVSKPGIKEDISLKAKYARYYTSYEKGQVYSKTCLTGYMTNVQNWVDAEGDLSTSLNRFYTIDVSKMQNAVAMLNKEIEVFNAKHTSQKVKYLSLAKCGLQRVPAVFNLKDRAGQPLHLTVEYLTLYGNEFYEVSIPGDHYGEYLNATDAEEVLEYTFHSEEPSAWATGFNQATLSSLKQLDLRKCCIQRLTSNIFENMPRLEALYLGENMIKYVAAQAFYGLKNLLHLDLSMNIKTDGVIVFENTNVFDKLQKLISLDFSKTQIQQQDVTLFKHLPDKLQRLSICESGIIQLPSGIFNHTNLKYLDLSCNNGILSRNRPLEGLEKKLEVLYAEKIGLRSFDVFKNFTDLKILDLEDNEISTVSSEVTKTLTNLTILDLSSNRITSWVNNVFKYITTLKVLSVSCNNINLITNEMMVDFRNLSYLGIGTNFILCNCNTRELFELAYRNQNRTEICIKETAKTYKPFTYHSGYEDFEAKITNRNNITRSCDEKYCSVDNDIKSKGNFILYDYYADGYTCVLASEAKSVSFSHVNTCIQSEREMDDVDLADGIQDGWARLYILFVIPVLVFPLVIFSYVFRRNLRYFCITMKNSATLSLLNKDKVVDDNTIFNYDVFVSYCNEDRIWVLDQLLPHVEKDCNVSVCLHERDFQVGLSILENIVSCMDRSRTIMLIISQRFLLSQWCQFEMHLAQHRLLETRREDLILVLLEEIPRRLRPTTLHYLMLTKTYIVWPKTECEHGVFWRRLTRSLTSHGLKSQENISLA